MAQREPRIQDVQSSRAGWSNRLTSNRMVEITTSAAPPKPPSSISVNETLLECKLSREVSRQNYTKEGLNELDNHYGEITHLSQTSSSMKLSGP